MWTRRLVAAVGVTAALALGMAAHATPILDGALVLRFDAQDMNADGDTSNNPAPNTVLTGSNVWRDGSGGGRHLSTVSGGDPYYRANQPSINNLSFVDFDGGTGSDRMTTPSITAETLAGPSRNTVTTILAMRFIDNAAVNVWWKWETAASNRDGMEENGRWDFPNDVAGSGNLPYSPNLSDAAWHIMVYQYTGTQRQVYRDGQLVATRDMTAGLSAGSSSLLHIGANNGNNYPSDVDFAEILHYNRSLSATERVIVENYLSSKYNLPLATGSGARDRYAGDTPANGDYDFGVFGVGRVSSTDFLLSASTAAGAGLGITVDGASLDDDEWLLAGRKVLNPATNSIISFAEGSIAGDRWSRVWFLDVTGAMTGSLTFDFSDANLTVPPGATVAQLLSSPTEPYNWTIVGSAAITGDTVTFMNLAFTSDGYYTLALNAQVVPEPGSLALVALGLAALARTRRRIGLRRAS